MRRIQWVIINEENLEEKIAQLTAGGAPLAIFALTAQGYDTFRTFNVNTDFILKIFTRN